MRPILLLFVIPVPTPLRECDGTAGGMGRMDEVRFGGEPGVSRGLSWLFGGRCLARRILSGTSVCGKSLWSERLRDGVGRGCVGGMLELFGWRGGEVGFGDVMGEEVGRGEGAFRNRDLCGGGVGIGSSMGLSEMESVETDFSIDLVEIDFSIGLVGIVADEN